MAKQVEHPKQPKALTKNELRGIGEMLRRVPTQDMAEADALRFLYNRVGELHNSLPDEK